MKKLYALLFVSLLFASCGQEEPKSLEAIIATQDLKKIRSKKIELDTQQKTIANHIQKLIAEIQKLDTLKKIPLVTGFKIQKENFNHYIEIQGNVKTKQNLLVYPEIAGTLISVLVKEGQAVKKGQVLAHIDDGGMTQQLAQIKASAALAKTTFERQERLWNQKIGSEIQFLQTKTNYESQKNAVAQLQQQLQKSSIIAPFSGIVDEVIKNEGTIVSPGPGSEIFRIVNLSKMYIEADVPESYIATISKGKSVDILFPVLGKKISTSIRQTGNFINPANRTFKIEIGVPNSDNSIKPNLTAKLKINDYSNTEAILIPQSMLSENANGQQYVYVISNIKNAKGTAKQVIVQTGKTQGDLIEILAGVAVGDLLIEAGARSVKDGQEIKIAKS